MKTSYLLAWDTITKANVRRTYTRHFNNLQDAEKAYQAKIQQLSTIDIWLIQSELEVVGNAIQRGYKYIHEPKHLTI